MSNPTTTTRPLPPIGATAEKYVSINDNLESSNPSLKTVLIVLGSVVGIVGSFWLYAVTIGL
jgi:hypothetical protein